MATTFQKLISLMAYDATLTERTDDFYLRAKTVGSLSLQDIAREYAAQNNRNADEVYAILNGVEQIKADAIASGYIVNTPTALYQPAATGTVLKADLSKPVDHDKVKVYATVSQGSLLREAMDACRLEIFTQPAVVGPLLNGAVAETRAADGTTMTRTAPTPGKNLTLTGRNIKVVGTDPSVGITFTSVESPQTTVKVSPADITVNEPTRLIFVLPDEVTDGLWTVSVTTQFGSNRNLVKTPRTYVLDTPLGVGTAYQNPEEDGGSTVQPGGGGGGETEDGDEGSFG